MCNKKNASWSLKKTYPSFMKKIIYTLLLTGYTLQLNAQKETDISSIEKEAKKYYKTKNYEKATSKYLQLADISYFKRNKSIALYMAARALASQNKVDSSFILLDKAIANGFKYKTHLINDSDLAALHNNPKWETLINKITTKSLNDDPNLAKIITKDVHNFWKAYDLVTKDTSNAYNIYKKNYFDKASNGMEDYMGLKVKSIAHFIAHLNAHPKLYQTIRPNTLKVDEYKDEILQSFRNFKQLYAEAKFPDVYFVIGAFTSGGTVSPEGLLIGTNQMSYGEDVNTEEVVNKLRINKSETLPHVVAHELIHFQQDGLKNEKITLKYAIQEGMADFIGELISGKTANEKIFKWAKGKEKKIWKKFTKDMYNDRYSNWIANYNTVSEDSYPDLGYWIGYQICKSYYENTSNKKQAIYDMLHIQDYKKFLADSKWEKKLDTLK